MGHSTKYQEIENRLDDPPTAEVVYDLLPKHLPHGWKFLIFGPAGRQAVLQHRRTLQHRRLTPFTPFLT